MKFDSYAVKVRKIILGKAKSLSDNPERAFFTVKHLQGIDISGHIEAGMIRSISAERINANALQGPGSEISIGALLYSYTFG